MKWIYEIQLELSDSILDKAIQWLPTHMKHVIAAGGFSSAEFSRVEDPDNPKLLVVRYYANSRAQIDDYVRDQAPKLRPEVVQQLGTEFKATRRILRVENLMTAQT